MVGRPHLQQQPLAGCLALVLGLAASPIAAQPDQTGQFDSAGPPAYESQPASPGEISLDLSEKIAEAAALAAQLDREANDARTALSLAEEEASQARRTAELASERLSVLETQGRRARAERDAAQVEAESLSTEAAAREATVVARQQEAETARARAQEARLHVAALEGQAAAVAAEEEAAAALERAEAAEERARALEAEASVSQTERDEARGEAEALRVVAAEKEAERAAKEQEATLAEQRAEEAQVQAAEAEERASEAKREADELQDRAEALEQDLDRSRRRWFAALAVGILVLLAVPPIAWRLARRRRRELEASQAARRRADEKLATAIVPAAVSCLLEGRDTDGRAVVVKIGAELLGSPDGVVVGRSPGRADAVIDHQEASRAHFRLTEEDGTLFIADLHSTNGTYVNGTEIGAGETVPLADGDEVGVGAAIRLTVSTD